MLKEELTNQVLSEMNDVLEEEQKDTLKSVLTVLFYNFDINKKETGLTTERDNNYFYIEKFKATMQVQHMAPATIYHYTNSVHKFLLFVNKNFKEITSDDVNFYLAKLTKKGTMSATSLDNERKYIKPFFKWALRNDLIDKNPFDKIDPIKRIEKKKEILTETEIEMIRDICKNNKKELALVDFLLATGVRVSECSNAKISNIDFDRNIVNIYGQKTGKWREVFMDAKSYKHLSEYLNERTNSPSCYNQQDILFMQERGEHRSMSSYCINKTLKNIAVRAGVNKHCTCHLFRKTLASKLSAKGMSSQKIAAILGNSSAVSEKYYILIPSKDIENEYIKCMN